MNIARGLGAVFNRANVVKTKLFTPKYLFYTNIGISISLSAVGDILEQHYEILKVNNLPKFRNELNSIVERLMIIFLK